MNNTLFAIGEALIDFIPSETAVRLPRSSHFRPKSAVHRQMFSERLPNSAEKHS